ncbi:MULTISPECIES: fimbrial protein [Enterobacter cloacae complex]|uniref:fimbrial protein n=1 Tax=Enterobacter cloacae complex TaxID=354276 RepID=UPI00186603E0|nr:fimbrial protein [Enterobacter cloacae complex sp. I2]EKS7429247.1 type 1 fimbrial protein [Enterobacter cancerogenus]MBE3513144.1 type 1 fimbrial protein [Enterobacter cloacae complex sp. I2]
MSRQHDFSHRRRNAAAAILLAMLVSSALSQNAYAVDDWNVDGEHGELHVHGLLLEGACQLDMTSAWQQVNLGKVARYSLAKPGDRGEPVAFQIALRRCSRSGGNQLDRYTGTSTQDAVQPVVTLSFTGVSVPGNASLLEATGVSGLGLALTDPKGRKVTLGERAEPLFLQPGDNILTYLVTPVRTAEPLTTGAFRAVAGFKVSYD